jgi:PAS domain S-box-containing protein
MKNLRSLPAVAKHSVLPALSHTQLQHLFNSLAVIVCAIDAKGYITYVSKACADIWGYQPEELIGTRHIDLVLGEDHEKMQDYTARLKAGQLIPFFENRYYRKDGSIVPMSWAGRWDAQDKVLYAVMRDITERKANEALVNQCLHDVKDIIERITDGFFAVDREWHITYGNKEAENIVNVKRENIIGKNFWDCYPEAVGSIFEKEYRRAMEHQVSVHFEAYYPEPLNIWFDVYAYPSPNGLSIFFRDITERKKAEEELRKLSLIARETVNPVVITSPDNIITWVNDAFTRVSGYTLEEAVGKAPAELIDGPETDTKVLAYIREQQQKGQPYHAELVNYTKSGEKYWSAIYGQPILDEWGNVQQFYSIETDITERKRLQEQLNREQEQRQKKITAAVIKAQEQERAQVGQELHDNINQVLTTVKLYNELALDGVGDTTELLQKSIQYLQHSIDEIRHISKKLAAPTLGKIDLKETLEELAESIMLTNKLAVTTNYANVNDLCMDKDLHVAVYRIIQEHLTNVLKHSQANTVHIALHEANSHLCISVVDNGVGFDIYEKRKGIGITNMISRAESVNGKLELKSAPGQGCKLKVCLPLVMSERCI